MLIFFCYGLICVYVLTNKIMRRVDPDLTKAGILSRERIQDLVDCATRISQRSPVYPIAKEIVLSSKGTCNY